MNTNQGKSMDQERIAELRLHEKHLRASGQMVGACLGECLDAIESTQAELAALRGQVGCGLTVEECNENAPLRNMAPLAVRVPRLPVRRLETEAHPADTRPKPSARALPASRVLGDGEAAVDEEELAALRCLDDAVTINGDGMSTEALGVDWEVARSAKRRLSDIRAAKGGT